MKSLSHEERIDWVRLIRSENVGPITFYRLLNTYGTARAALEALPELARRGGRAKRVKVCSRAAAEREVAAVDAVGARLVAWGEAEYPPLLGHVEDAPPLLSVKGHPHLLAKAAVAVVGARNASLAGRKMAGELAADLGRNGLLVVSGMARGVDTAAHEGALATGTLAVLAGGVDVIYPKENRGLYDRLVESGALVSEIEPGVVPQARHFPKRNRIISGVARGVVVVEASPRSGSLITARTALDQGREVFAVPGSPLDPRSKGTNDLIRQGAVLTESAADVLDLLARSERRPMEERKRSYGDVLPEIPDESELSEGRSVIQEILGPTAVTVDEVIRCCQFSPAVVSTVLLELELAGRLERQPGNRVSMIGNS